MRVLIELKTRRPYNGTVRFLSWFNLRVACALVMALLIVALVACRGITPSAQYETPQVKPVGGELVMLGTDPSTLDPHRVTDTTSALFVAEVFGGLVTLTTDLQVVPDLASEWELSADGTVYTFRLRPDARFHNGKVVTANDVRWSLERATNPATASPAASGYLNDISGVLEKLSGKASDLSGVEVVDEHTLRITIDAPKSYFLSKLTYPAAFVLDKENVSDEAWTSQPNGTGPFKLEEYVPKQRLVLERNPDYHLGAPYLERVRFLLGGGNATFMYENDEVHIIGVGSSLLERVMDPASPLHNQLVTSPGGFATDYIGMNVNTPPFDDVNVRQALNYAIDKERLIHAFLNDQVVMAKGVLPPGFPGYNPNLKGFDYDPEKARELLRTSRYGESIPPITLTLSGSFGQPPGAATEAILGMWRDNLGIEVELQETEFNTFLKDLQSHRLAMFQIGWVADYPDPENFLDNLFYSGSGNNNTRYSNLEVDSLLEKARVERDVNTRLALYHQAEDIIVKDAPWILLWHPGESHFLVKPYVHGYRPTPLVVPVLRYVYMSR